MLMLGRVFVALVVAGAVALGVAGHLGPVTATLAVVCVAFAVPREVLAFRRRRTVRRP